MTDTFPLNPARNAVAVLTALALAFALAPAAGTATAQEPPPNAPCPDGLPPAGFVDRDQARAGHAASIDCVAFHAIARGSTDAAGNRVYRPARIVNRGQMATFIAQTLTTAGLELTDGRAPDEFPDLDDTVHGRSINALARAGVVAGYADGRYRPSDRVSRAQMATFLVQAAEWASDDALDAQAGPYFADTVASTHEANIDAGFEHRLFEGRLAPDADVERSGRFAPRDGTRRDQMATFLSRLLDYLWELQGIAGLVTDADTDEPVEGATVSFLAEPVDPDADHVTAETSDAGTFFAELDPGTYSVAAGADGYLDADLLTGVVVEERQLTIIRIELEAGVVAEPDTGTIAGAVTDDDTGHPIEGATIAVLDGNDDPVGQESTDGQGDYAIDVEVGTYTVTAGAEGYVEASQSGVAVTADETVTVDFALEPEPEPEPAVLTADPEVVPVSDVANPSSDPPNRGVVSFVLNLFDDEGNPIDSTGRNYTFSIQNTGASEAVACIRCTEEEGGPQLITVAAGGFGLQGNVADINRVLVDAADPTSVTVTVTTTVDGEERSASASATWIEVDEEPTGAGQAVSHSGTVTSFNRADGAQWYLLDDDSTIVFVEYAGGTTDTYRIDGQTASVAEFADALAVGAHLDYETDAADNQQHALDSN